MRFIRPSRRRIFVFRSVCRSLALAVLAVLPLGAFIGTPAAGALGKGQPDPSFGSGGFAVLSSSRLFATAVQSDGKVVVVGDDEATPQHLLVARLNSNGSIDSSFNGGHPALGPADTVGRAVAIQSDGKVVVAGMATGSTATDPTEGSGMIVERFTGNGQPDGGFGTSGVTVVATTGGLADSVAIQSDGKIVVGGSDTGPSGFPQTAFARFNTNGSLDGSFGSGGVDSLNLGRYSVANGIAIQTDGRIVFGGSERDDLRTTAFLAGRLNSNGSLDAGFGSGGVFLQQFSNGAATSEARGLALQPDGKVVLSGDAADGSLGSVALAVRLTTGGHPDGGFGSGGVARLPAADNPNQCCGEDRLPGAYAAAVSGGEIVLGGAYDSAGRTRFAVWGLNSGGSLDGGFGSGGRLLGPVGGQNVLAMGLAVAPDGNFVVDGFASAPFTTPSGLVGRIGGPPIVVAKVKASLKVSRTYRRSDVLKHGLKVGVSCNQGCSVRLTLNTTSAVAQKLHFGHKIRRCRKVRGRRICTTTYAGGALATVKATLSNGALKTFTLNNGAIKRAAKTFSTVHLTLKVSAQSLSTHQTTTASTGVTIKK
jgi:uncharacterized delta-60 repeat protein